MKDDTGNIKALITIPAFNEELRIGELLGRLLSWKNEVMVIDDGSADATSQVVTGMGFRCHSLPVNSGLAAAYSAAEAWAAENDFSHILALDADGQHDPDFIPAFLAAMGKYDLVSGSRFHHPDLLPDPKIASNLFAILLFKEVLGISLPDVSCGFRGWKIGSLLNGNKAQHAATGRFGIIYDMLLNHVIRGKMVGFTNIPAIYHKSDPVNTKIPEIIGLVSTIMRYKSTPGIQLLLDDVLNNRNFTIYLSGFRIDARLATADAYIFDADMASARQFLISIQNQSSDEHKS